MKVYLPLHDVVGEQSKIHIPPFKKARHVTSFWRDKVGRILKAALGPVVFD